MYKVLNKEEVVLNVETIVKESSIIYRLGETLGIKTQDFEIRMSRKINPFTTEPALCLHARVCHHSIQSVSFFWREGGVLDSMLGKALELINFTKGSQTFKIQFYDFLGT